MAVFAEMAFLVVVGVAFVLMQVKVSIPRTTWFGLINLMALSILFGWRATMAIVAISLVYWLWLTIMKKIDEASPDGSRASVLLCAVAYMSVAFLFIGHKMLLEPGNDFAGWAPFGALSFLASRWPMSAAFTFLQMLAFSYVCLRLVDAIRAVRAGERVVDPVAFSGFLVPFFMTPSGPINEYESHREMDDSESVPPSAALCVDCIWLVTCGYFLKFFCAQSLGLFVRGISGAWPVTSFWDSAIFLSYVFLEFCGYSLIALGVGRLLSVPTPVNFNHPYFATSFADFWTRWHMSLGNFVRRTFYFPLRISLTRLLKPGRRDLAKIHFINAVALIVPFTLVGFWHRFSWMFLLWGLVVGVVVAAETIVREIWSSWGVRSAPSWIVRPLVSIYSVAVVIYILQIALQDFAK